MMIPLVGISQEKLDCLGMPNDFHNINTGNTPKYNGEDFPLTDYSPTLSFASPTLLPSGIAWDGSKLWVCGYNEYKIYCVSADNGSVLSSFPTHIRRPYGIAYDNDRLFVLDNESKMIIKYDLNGNKQDSISLICNCNINFPAGLCVKNNNFWFNDTQGSTPSISGDSTYRREFLNSTTIEAFLSFGDFPTGMAVVDDYLYVNDNPSQSTYKIDRLSFQIVERFTAPGGVYPNGLAWGNEGLWYVNNASDSIYFVPQVTTQVVALKSFEDYNVYPNPANDVLFFHAPNGVTSCDILDITGKEVMTVNEMTFANVSNLKSGVYMVRFNDGMIKKILISR